ncbi:MAG: phenylacetate-CoA oxygenase subunit PaaC [Ignavibacteria bacterium]|nr:phenylacetate-CoA oxygenase subunit PaaC [Ignavibacteria bacterium]
MKPNTPLQTLLLSLADDELILGHRDSEWTGHAPILEEDIAFSNIAQDEMGHALVWYSLVETDTGRTPDQEAFEREWDSFTCCRFVSYPKGDFAYTIMRQFLFDQAETVRLESFLESSHPGLKEAAGKIIREETYHLMHSQGLVHRLGDATPESRKRMQQATHMAFPQSLGIFEPLEGEAELVSGGVFAGNRSLQAEWLRRIIPVLHSVGLSVPADPGGVRDSCIPDYGGRIRDHNEHLKELVDNLQSVYRSVPGGTW